MGRASRHIKSARCGFTLLELALATVLGAIVVLAAGGMLYAASRTEASFERVATNTAELEITRSTVQRAWDNLVTLRGAPPENQEEGAGPRPRILLETDDAADPGVGMLESEGPQRLELALASAPISMALATQAASSVFAQDDAASRDFISADGSGGAMRGVFEWRRDGVREKVLSELGLRSVLADEIDERPDGRRGWTLWFRRLPAWEVERAEYGLPQMADTEGTPDEQVQRLAGCVRLVTGVTDGRWSIFEGYERVPAFNATYTSQVPVFVEFEAEMLTGRRVSWMFEVAWTEGADPVPVEIAEDEVPADEGGGAGEDGAPENTTPAAPGGRRGRPTTGAGVRESEA